MRTTIIALAAVAASGVLVWAVVALSDALGMNDPSGGR